MITVRKADERHVEQRHRQQLWHSFNPPEPTKPHDGGCSVLESLSENSLPPGGISMARPSRGVELVTYVYQGTISQEDSSGSSSVVHAGEFQRMAIGHGIRHKETNASRTNWAHVYRISLRTPDGEANGAREQMHVAAALRHNVLRIVASPDGHQGSLHTQQDALVFSGLIDPGHHLIHELLPGRNAWLHVICGEAVSHDMILTQGDGLGVTDERSVSLTAHEKCEILLVDVGEQVGGVSGPVG
jgi:redox-sensitive bicupin YhaK (pirin superfamily)